MPLLYVFTLAIAFYLLGIQPPLLGRLFIYIKQKHHTYLVRSAGNRLSQKVNHSFRKDFHQWAKKHPPYCPKLTEEIINDIIQENRQATSHYLGTQYANTQLSTSQFEKVG